MENYIYLFANSLILHEIHCAQQALCCTGKSWNSSELFPFDRSLHFWKRCAVSFQDLHIIRINLIYGYSWSVLGAIKGPCKALEMEEHCLTFYHVQHPKPFPRDVRSILSLRPVGNRSI